jgi:hypothetical protein
VQLQLMKLNRTTPRFRHFVETEVVCRAVAVVLSSSVKPLQKSLVRTF